MSQPEPVRPAGGPSIRNMADLARAGFEIARQALTKVDFEVHHVTARPRYLYDLVTTPDSVFLETLCSAANGGGVVIGTRTRDMVDAVTPLNGPVAPTRPETSDDAWVFRQTALPNPNFIYESARTFEGLIVMDQKAPVLTHGHAITVRDLLKEISETAVSMAGAPLLTLQCPAQLPTQIKTPGHDLRVRRERPVYEPSLAVRFSIALQDASAERRFELGDRLRALCEKYGFGFWIADTRPGHRPGNWFRVCQGGSRAEPLAEAAPITTCLPLTCVGPARVGSTHAIVAFLQRYPEVGIAGCTGTSLDDLAFVHLQLSFEGVAADRLNKILARLLAGPSVPTRPHELLRKLFFRLGLRAVRELEPGGTHPASDYQTFLGPAFTYRAAAVEPSLPLWISWRIAFSGRGLSDPLACLYRALGEILPDAESTTVEYLVCRVTEQSVVRGKAKLAIPKKVVDDFGSSAVERAESRLSARLEDAWKAQADLACLDGVTELTVAWRESWLGHYTFT